MITLITGMPGAGKTLLLVAEFLTEAQQKGRPVIADGIPELVIQHTPAAPVVDWTVKVPDPSSQEGEKLLFTFPEGSLVVIDECQRVFRPRATTKQVPPEVAAFETHRHQGLDFVLITQHPGLLDANVRRLVGRHLHIRDVGILGRKVYEWPEATDPEKFRNAPIQRSWKLPKNSFALYKSSSLHIKPKRGIPKGVAALAVTIPLLLAGGGYAWNSIQKKTQSQPVPVAVQQQGQPSVVGGQVAPVVDRAAMLLEFDPAVPGRPETAPAFDALRVVKNMPVVAGCVQTKARCSCQNQQGLDAGLDDLQCKRWLENPPFDAYREQIVVDDRRQAVGAAEQTRQPGAVRRHDPMPIESKESVT